MVDVIKNIPEEQPPEDPELLKEWLARMMILINGALDNTDVMDVTGQMPISPTNGMFKYFPEAIPPQIEFPGPWVYIDGVWHTMTKKQDLIIVTSYEPDQVPVAFDTPLKLLWGVGVVPSLDGSVEIAADGTVTWLRDAFLDFTLIIHYKRDNNNNQCYMVFSSAFNGNPASSTIIKSISNTNEPEGFEFTFSVQGVTGNTLELFLTRDSAGTADGYIHTFTPTNPAISPGFGTTMRVVRDI